MVVSKLLIQFSSPLFTLKLDIRLAYFICHRFVTVLSLFCHFVIQLDKILNLMVALMHRHFTKILLIAFDRGVKLDIMTVKNVSLREDSVT
jgi:hypothetical protein